MSERLARLLAESNDSETLDRLYRVVQAAGPHVPSIDAMKHGLEDRVNTLRRSEALDGLEAAFSQYDLKSELVQAVKSAWDAFLALQDLRAVSPYERNWCRPF